MQKIITTTTVILCLTLSTALWANDVRISNLVDINFPTWQLGMGDLYDQRRVCVYSDTGLYQVTISGSGPGSSLQLTDMAVPPNVLPYSVFWRDNILAPIGTELSANIPFTGQSNANTTHETCASGPSETAQLDVRILDTDLQSAVMSMYSGTIFVTIAPE